MEFRHYDPEDLIPILKERGLDNSDYKVCQGCVFADIPAEDCYHPWENFETPDVQSDMVCPQCCITINDSKKPFHFHKDPDMTQKVSELETILDMASGH